MLASGALGVLLALPLGIAAPPAASDGARSRITIRGTGSNVTVETADGAPRSRLTLGPATAPVLAEAVRMKEAGTSDDALVWYLRGHASEIPPFVDYDTVSRLRSAGAGRTVIAYLSGVAAVEIGPTGAVGGPVSEESVEALPEPEMSNALPIGLAYGFAGPGGRGHRRFSGRPIGMRSLSRPTMHPFAPRRSPIEPTPPLRRAPGR